MEIFNRIKFDGAVNNADWLIYKVDKEDMVLGSQLVVGPGQEAIFVKSGQALDVFSSGTHTLSTGNLPLLNKLVQFPFGGKTPFTAEVYYVNQTINQSLKWGTSAPIIVEDPKYGLLLHLRAFGTYGMKVIDSRLLLNQLFGVMQLGSGFNRQAVDKQFIGFINMKLKTIVMQFLRESKVSFLEIAAYYDMLSSKVTEAIADDFERFGVQLVNFYIESITPPKEEFEKLQGYKEELALGEGFYAKRRSFDVLEGMADSPMGNMTGMGIGLGAGMYAGAAMNNAMGQIASNINVGSDAKTQEASLVCTACGKALPPNSQFCSACGAKVVKEKKCPNCGNVVAGDAKFCSKCGTALTEKHCTKCGSKLEEGSAFCSNCGTKWGD